MSGRVCSSCFSFSLDNFLRRRLQDPGMILRGYVKPGMTVVDIGCGPGYFSVPMARMVGEGGKVICVDLQEKMLGKLSKRAEKHGMGRRIIKVRCEPDDLKVREKADFVLTFWMVHEVGDAAGLFRQVREIMKPGSYYLLSEPKMHVGARAYGDLLAIAASSGLRAVREENISMSRSMVFSL